MVEIQGDRLQIVPVRELYPKRALSCFDNERVEDSDEDHPVGEWRSGDVSFCFLSEMRPGLRLAKRLLNVSLFLRISSDFYVCADEQLINRRHDEQISLAPSRFSVPHARQ
jgi:hypothetical protein